MKTAQHPAFSHDNCGNTVASLREQLLPLAIIEEVNYTAMKQMEQKWGL